MTKKKLLKRKLKETEAKQVASDEKALPSTRFSDEPEEKKTKWINKTRVLVFSARGISYRDRHLMKDLRSIMPHSKEENKIEKRDNWTIINEMCEMKNCDKCILLEGRRKRDLYMWIANVPTGPCANFLVESVFTMGDLKLTGNCLKGSRPLLSFDGNFSSPHYSLLKELFTQVFSVPNHHPKSQPFFDHVLTFSIHDNRIWVRNFQILTESGALAEIGPRFVLNPIKIFEGSFCGATLWENPNYVTPTSFRRQLKLAAAGKYLNRKQQKEQYELNKPEKSYESRTEDEIFSNDAKLVAEKILEESAKNDEENQTEEKWKPGKLFKHNSKKSSIPKLKVNKLKRRKQGGKTSKNKKPKKTKGGKKHK
ncbi:hypothetical protein LSTR_LSTR008377 [Laodelphax striatellus]|uniref:Ribosome biogenesis protein BRX1 homolog n=1 Tax=Laodelphax striatellus TaxID=195883 RepID=A0A482XYC8_LAOST|nr:hypothetical protein LSTR_LSTR008377 [Laodelphax striatellus]